MEFLKEIAIHTGLPAEEIQKEIGKIIELAGLNESEITLEKFRDLLAEYMQDVLVKLKSEIEAK